MLNSVQFKGTIHIGVSESGLYLCGLRFVGVGNAPILIPWSDLQRLQTEKWYWFTVLKTSVQVGKFDRVEITFMDRDISDAVQNAVARHAATQAR